jgi:hypothetical protein
VILRIRRRSGDRFGGQNAIGAGPADPAVNPLTSTF